jgi:hypothetical protein
VKIESPYFKDMLQKISLFCAGYRPPALKRLKTDCIDKEKALLEKDLQVCLHSKQALQREF